MQSCSIASANKTQIWQIYYYYFLPTKDYYILFLFSGFYTVMAFVVWKALLLFASGGNASSVCVPASPIHVSPELIKRFVYFHVIQLSRTVAKTQADFVSEINSLK